MKFDVSAVSRDEVIYLDVKLTGMSIKSYNCICQMILDNGFEIKYTTSGEHARYLQVVSPITYDYLYVDIFTHMCTYVYICVHINTYAFATQNPIAVLLQ